MPCPPAAPAAPAEACSSHTSHHRRYVRSVAVRCTAWRTGPSPRTPSRLLCCAVPPHTSAPCRGAASRPAAPPSAHSRRLRPAAAATPLPPSHGRPPLPPAARPSRPGPVGAAQLPHTPARAAACRTAGRSVGTARHRKRMTDYPSPPPPSCPPAGTASVRTPCPLATRCTDSPSHGLLPPLCSEHAPSALAALTRSEEGLCPEACRWVVKRSHVPPEASYGHQRSSRSRI